MLLGRCIHPKKSLPAQLPSSKALCAAATSLSMAATSSALTSAFLMSSLIIFLSDNLMSFSISDAKVHHFCDIAAFPTQNFFPFRKNVPIIKSSSALYIIRYARGNAPHKA